MRARIVLADDHAAFLAMAARLIEAEYDIVGTFSDGREVVEAASALELDLWVLDLSMPYLSGLEIASWLRAEGHPAKILILTVHEDQDYVRCALEAGAAGYVLKRKLATDLLPALREVLAGRNFVSEP